MLNKLAFYNHYGNGDVFESREFVRELIEIFPAKEVIYYTSKSPRILMDIPEIRVENTFPSYLSSMSPFLKRTGELYINTWIGRDGKYVLQASGCTLEKLYDMYNDLLSMLGEQRRLSKDRIDYLTDFDYSLYEIGEINKYIEKMKGTRMILISDGPAHSNQAINFDMNPLIAKLALEFPEYMFFITSNSCDYFFKEGIDNVISANSLTPSYLESNLVEISYLSRFCDVLVGRNSGPQVFSWTKENVMSPKINFTFTKHIDCSHFVREEKIVMKKLWSDSINIDLLSDSIIGIFKDELRSSPLTASESSGIIEKKENNHE